VSKRAQLIRQARDLYAEGRSLAEIARLLDLSRNTLGTWRRRDAEAGLDWGRLRAERARTSPYARIAALQERLERLIREATTSDDPSYEDKLLKLIRALDALEERLGDAARLLGALEVFARWAADKLSDEPREVVAYAIERFCDDLRHGRAGAQR